MTLLYTSDNSSTGFDATTSGTTPTGWTSITGTWQVGTTTPVTGHTHSFGDSLHADGHVAHYTGMSAVADQEIVWTTIASTSGVTTATIGGIVRSDSGNNNHYLCIILDTTHVAIFKKVGGTYTQLTSATFGFTIANSDVLNTRFQAIGTALKCKVWKASGTEPSSWAITTTDSAVTAAGIAGVYSAQGTFGAATPVCSDFNIDSVNSSANELLVLSDAPTGSSITVSGTYIGTAPTALDYAVDGGTYSAATSPTISGGNFSFSITAPATGFHSISVRDHTTTAETDSGIFNVTNSGGAATSYTLTGPTSGTTGVASTNFTVQAVGTPSGSVTVTPATSGTGTFSPTTVTLAATLNSSATFTYTPGVSETATISTTNSSTLTDPSGISYTSSPANTIILPNNAALVYSPYNWNVSGSNAITINPGAYFRMLFTGTSVVLNFDVSAMASPASQIWWKVDNGPWTQANVAATVTPTIPAALLSKSNIPYHLLTVVVKSMTQGANRWNTGVTTTAVNLTSITLDASASVAAPKKAPRNVLVYGDSISEGTLTLYESAANDTDRNDSMMASTGFTLGHLLGAEIGVVACGGQGYVTVGTAATNVPTFPNAYNLLYQGVSRTFSPTPDLIVIEEGTNDGSTSTTTAATGVFNNISTAVGTTVPVAVLRPLNGTAQSTFLTNAIAATTTPSQFHFIDTAGFFSTTYGVDSGGLHPSGPNAVGEIAPQVAGQLKTLLTGTSGGLLANPGMSGGMQ